MSVGVLLVVLLVGCASNQVVLLPVGPAPDGLAGNDHMGFLQVFSATAKSPAIVSDDNAVFKIHSGYDIQDQSGQLLEFVPNHTSNMDESPDHVKLPIGIYKILAQSSCCGQVIVPVLIEEGKSTLVHLDRDWFPPGSIPTSRLVYLPDGEAVGWSGRVRE